MNKINKSYIAVFAAFIIGGLIMNRTDAFVSDHTFKFQSPIIVQSPIVVNFKPLVSPIKEATHEAIKSTEATPSAQLLEVVPEVKK